MSSAERQLTRPIKPARQTTQSVRPKAGNSAKDPTNTNQKQEPGAENKTAHAFNLMPIRALRFAYNYAMPTIEVCTAKRRADFEKFSKQARAHITPIYTLGSDPEKVASEDPMDLYRCMRIAASVYTNIFYSMQKEELLSYISICNERGVFSRRPTEENILVYPAMMAYKGSPKALVRREILRGLYKKPFQLMHAFARDAIRIDMFKQSVSIKTIPEETLDYVRRQIALLQERISAIEKSNIRPTDDEDFKKGFIDSVVELTMEGDICLAHYMEERLDNTRSYGRIMRA